ncbi:conjugal transfer protein, partial [Proteus mirabilis]|nr:conjugal transfer protein [Proteus mirabilis]
MKSKIVAISLFFLPVLSQADVPVFTGDVKLA